MYSVRKRNVHSPHPPQKKILKANAAYLELHTCISRSKNFQILFQMTGSYLLRTATAICHFENGYPKTKNPIAVYLFTHSARTGAERVHFQSQES